MSFNYKIACASAVAEGCEANRSNFFFDGKAMKKENHGTSAPLCSAVNSDSEQCVGIFEGVTSPEAAHVAINCLRYFLNQKNEEDTEYINQLNEFYSASDRVISGLDQDEDKRVSCTVGFVRYNGFYFATAGDCLVYLWRNGELDLLNPPENETRPLGGEGTFAPEPIYGEIFTGERIVICTTSMKKALSDEHLRTILAESSATETCVDALCKASMERGISDCCSCCVIDIGEKTSEGYWILPGLVFTPEQESSEILFEADSSTIEISSGKALGVEESEEEPAVEIEEELLTLPALELPEQPVNDSSPIVTVDEIEEQQEEKKPASVVTRRSAKEKQKQTIIICAVIAGVLLLGLIMTFVIKACATNPAPKDSLTTPEISDEISSDRDTEEPDDTTTKDRDTEDREEDTTRREPDDTTDPVSRDTEDYTTEEEPDDPATSDTANDTDEPDDSATDTSSDTTEDTQDTTDDTTDTTNEDTSSDTTDPVTDDTSSDTSDTAEDTSSDTSAESTDPVTSDTADTTADVVIDDTPSMTDSEPAA